MTDADVRFANEADLVAAALMLGARDVRGWSVEEERLAASAPRVSHRLSALLTEEIRLGADPLGEAFCALRSRALRRRSGATYTPPLLVAAMVDQGAARGTAPVRVVDAGCGSARFLVAAGHRFTETQLLGVELDPLAALMGRAHLAAAGLADRAEIRCQDFRALHLEAAAGATLFLGNPPYVRHHWVGREWKAWLGARCRALGLEPRLLAGLHLHFLVAIAGQTRPGDAGVLVTAAEWLDTDYGAMARALLLEQMGLEALEILEPTSNPFPDAAATAVVIRFRVGGRPPEISIQRRAQLSQAPVPAIAVPRTQLASRERWSTLPRRPRSTPEGWVPLGELCRVHRGTATGCNVAWITKTEASEIPPAYLFPTVTRARELIAAGVVLIETSHLRRVVDLPIALDELSPHERAKIEPFLARARSLGADTGFLATHRRAWWAVGLRAPAPLLVTYMARRPPAFVLNPAGARHLNIAHGLYPRAAISPTRLAALADHLRSAVSTDQGRTYAGGLTKFEPRELERILVPGLELLSAGMRS